MEVVILVICTVSQRMFLWFVDPTPFMCQSAKNFVMPCIRVGVGKKNLILQTMGHTPLEIGIDQQMLICQTPLNTTKYMLYFKMNLMPKWFKTSFNCFLFVPGTLIQLLLPVVVDIITWNHFKLAAASEHSNLEGSWVKKQTRSAFTPN